MLFDVYACTDGPLALEYIEIDIRLKPNSVGTMSVDIRGGRWLQFLMVAVGLLTYRASAFRKYDEDLALVAMAYSHAAYAVIPYPSDFTLIGNVTRLVS